MRTIIRKFFLIFMIVLVSLYFSGNIDKKNDGSLNVAIVQAAGEVENLDELIARKARVSSATWGYSLLEDLDNNYTWQPETMQYNDVTTDGEVWRFTYAPNAMLGGETQDLVSTHWNANGNRLMFHTQRATASSLPTFQPSPTAQRWMLSNADGSRLKPAKNAASQTWGADAYVLWSPILPEVLYSGASNDAQGLPQNALYKVTVSDAAISRESFLVLPATTSYTSVKKGISGDGRKVLIGSAGNFFPGTVYPEINKSWDVPSGYSQKRNFDFYWGGDVAKATASTYLQPVGAPLPSVVASIEQDTVTWTNVDGADSYNIYWSNTSPVNIATGTKIESAVQPKIFSELDSSRIYYYAMTAVTGGIEGPISNTISDWPGYHEKRLSGAVNGIDGVWSLMMPEGQDGPFWKMKIVGSAPDGGPLHIKNRTIPYTGGWGDIEPLNTATDGLNEHSPWCGDGSFAIDGKAALLGPGGCLSYTINSFGHGSQDRWGHYIISSKGNSSPYGMNYYDTRTHAYTTVFGINKIPHPDWEAWSDWSIASGYDNNLWFPIEAPTAGPLNPQGTWKFNYKTDQYSLLNLNHTRYNQTANPPYGANARPVQSPDGTKATFNSSFLVTSDSNTQLFWTVAYYPYPPEIKSATKISNNVRLTWDFNQGQNCSDDAGVTDRTGPTPNLTNPRTYATRGWPHETLDCAPSPREIKNFRVWSSNDNLTWAPIGTTTYNNCNGTNECGMWTETSWNFDAAQSNNTTKYYAITSLEHSGLESKTLSNVWKVTTDGSGNITEQVQQTTYPSDPGGKSNFFTTSPDAPTLISANYKEAPANADGQYTLAWTAPANHDLIRHYNIYAEDGSVPTATQQNRIASIPATSDYDADGNFSYIDWLGNTDGSTQYKITAVDFQGNESGVGTPADIVAPGAPQGLAVQ